MFVIRQLVGLAVVGIIIFAGWHFRADLPLIGGWFAGEDQTSGAAAERPATQVDVAAARSGSVTITMEAVGTIRANEAVTVTTKVRGLVARINFSEGEMVEAGTVLVELDSAEQRAVIEERRATLELEQARLVNAQQLYERSRRLMETNNVPQARLDEHAAQMKAAEASVRAAEAELRAAQVRLSDQRVVAPFSGRLGLRNVSVGALIEPGTALTTLDDLTPIKLDFQVPERGMSAINVGQEITAQTAAYPDRVFFGRVASIDTRVDPVTRAVNVRAEIPNEDEFLRPGLFMNVTLGVDTRANAVLIPEEAVVSDGNERYVYIVEDGIAKQSFIELGQRLPGEVEVLSGVAAGAVVVTGGTQKLRDGAPVAPREGPVTS